MSRLSVSLALGAAVVLSSASVAGAGIYTGTGGAFADAPENGTPGSVTYTITVGDAGQVGTFNGVTLNGLAHAFLGDLTATLTAPDGTVITIFDRIGKSSPDSGFGDSSNFLGNYAFKDGGASIWAAAQAVNGSSVVAAGIYAASAPLTGAPLNLQSLLAGRSTLGDWKLTISDFSVGEVGTLSGWVLDFSVVPSPGAVALLGLAGLTRSRRRR